MWEPQLALAERGWRVIAPQFRGFDGGRDPPARTSVDDYAGDVIDLLDALHIDEAVIGGLSMGGYVAFALLATRRVTFSGLVLADTPAAGRHAGRRRRPQADAGAARRRRGRRRSPTR